MREGERGRRISEQVHGPPDLMPDPPAHGRRGGDSDGDQECGAESGCSDRAVSEKVPGGGEEIGAGVGGVSAQSENHVCQAQREDMPSAATVPPREPVGADAVFDSGHARHEQQHGEHAVPVRWAAVAKSASSRADGLTWAPQSATTPAAPLPSVAFRPRGDRRAGPAR